MQFNDAVTLMFEKLGTHKIMAQAASFNDEVSIRNVSCIIYDNKIYFKTDKKFRKTKMLLENSNTALCFHGVQLSGIARNLGLVAYEDAGLKFAELYQKYWATSYNAYPHKESEILIEVTPLLAEIWDQYDNNHGFQVIIDFAAETALVEDYD